jgi:acetyl-CoA C-acetyltransferase
MSNAFIYDAVRTPRGRGRSDGSLNATPPVDLATTVLRAIADRTAIQGDDIEDVILGCVEPVGDQGSDLARTAALMAGYGDSVPGVQVHRYCASGLEACNMAAAQVMSGQVGAIVAGGVESLSRIPINVAGGAIHSDPRVAAATGYLPQGIAADLLATLYGYSRNDVDEYAVESQRRAASAWQDGYFENSVVPVIDVNGLVVLDRDEHLRPNTTVAGLAKLAPAFQGMSDHYDFGAVAALRYPEVDRLQHVHHSGNSSGIVDGAAAVLIGDAELGQKLGLKPRARIRSFASVGSEPSIMLTGPSFAAEKALGRAGMSKSDIDLWELNEAFAAVVLRFMDVLSIDHQEINVNGGGIAMGHPLGATGAMILGITLDELERRSLGTGLVSLCVGAGMGTATIIERV